MTTTPEHDAGITYAELGIDVSRCRPTGDCKTFCPRCHESRQNNRHDKSLSVNLDRGEWLCHHCQWGSGLGVSSRERTVGVRNASVATPPATPAPTPKTYDAPRTPPADLGTEALSWFASRKIPESVLRQYGVSSRMADGNLVVYFPYTVDGRLVNVKRRYGELPKLKSFGQEKNAERSLFGLDQAKGAKTVVIVEGEMDVLACAAAGWQAVSPPDGAPGQIRDVQGHVSGIADVGYKGAAFHVPSATALFGDADRIIVATDGDAEGQTLADWLIEQFGPLKCWRVEWPKGTKDANDVLMATGVKGLDEILSHAKAVPLPGVRSLAAHREKLHKLWHEGFSPGVTTGWPSFDHFYRPTLGHLVIISGYPGHGKTSWTNHFFTNLAMYNDWRIALYSPEMGEEGEVLGKFVQIAADAPYLPTASERMSLEAMDMSIDWVGERFYEVYADGHDEHGFSALTVPQILERVEPLVVKHGIKVLQIDPWNECESARPKHMTVEEYISSSLTTIRAWGKRHNVITAIVIHPRKPEMTKGMKLEESAPHPYESAGAAHWYNKADIFLTVHRMKWGEKRGTTTVGVAKHRREGISGNIGDCEFSFDRRSERFYCQGTVVPERIGANPYVDLPDALRLSPAPVRALALPGYDDEELF
jgi:twinkle protein